MANDSRPFNVKNIGNPKMDIKEMPARKISSMPSKTFSIPKNVGAANRPGRK